MMAVDINSSDEMRELYRELILDHARSPRHFGKLDDATHTAEGINPFCGDKLRLFVRLDNDEVIAAVKFEGSGCAISIASASLLTEMVTDMTVGQALDCFDAVTRRLTRPDYSNDSNDTIDLGKLRALDGVREFPSRVKCATLAWHALNSAIHGQSTTVSTE